jgi:hypothetical protein
MDDGLAHCVSPETMLYIWASGDFFQRVGFDCFVYAAGVASGAIGLIVTHVPWERFLWR